VELYLHSPNTSSCCGASLSIGTNLLRIMGMRLEVISINCSKIVELRISKGVVPRHYQWVLVTDQNDSLRMSCLFQLSAIYEGVSKSFRTGRLERELQMVQLSATRCSCIAIL
jgi:hypothetical protein